MVVTPIITSMSWLGHGLKRKNNSSIMSNLQSTARRWLMSTDTHQIYYFTDLIWSYFMLLFYGDLGFHVGFAKCISFIEGGPTTCKRDESEGPSKDSICILRTNPFQSPSAVWRKHLQLS